MYSIVLAVVGALGAVTVEALGVGVGESGPVPYCGPRELQAEGLPHYLTSPEYPLMSPPMSCSWTIVFPENAPLNMRVVDLDMEEDEKCSPGRSCCTHNWLSLANERICGRNITRRDYYFDMVTDGKVVVKFHSSKITNGGRGFRLLYFACQKRQLQCRNGLGCIEYTKKCDGNLDCSDGSDEWGCRKSQKPIPRVDVEDCKGDNYVPCGDPDPGCYNNVTSRCNDLAECIINGADETDCGVCGPKKLYCKYGGCYPYWGACDGTDHCVGGWDEGERGGCGICPSGFAPCGQGDPCHCYHTKDQRCDERIDCPNGEDELSCVAGCEDKIACASTQGCYSPSQRCDGIIHCPDKSDEIDCVRQFNDKFKCANGVRCIDDIYVCNGEDDCGDSSDEADCIRNSVVTVVVMGTLTCGMLAVIGITFAWRYYVSKIRPNNIEVHNAYQRQIDQGPLDEDALYHLYREPPPSYSEAVLQGASPPVYCQPARFVNISNHAEESPPTTTSRRIRPRPRRIRQVPKRNELAKPIEDSAITTANNVTSAVLTGDQLYPESGSSRDNDAPMLELSDNAVNNQENLSDLESNSSGATCGSSLISNESLNNHHQA